MNVKISITGRHMQVGAELKRYATEKAGRLERYSEALREIEVILEENGERKMVEMIAHPRKGERIVGQTEHEDMFAAIDLLVDKMYKQLNKQKSKQQARRQRNDRVPPPPAPEDMVSDGEPLETYDDVVEEFTSRFEEAPEA